MIDEQIAQMRTHRNNIDRYRRLLRTLAAVFSLQHLFCFNRGCTIRTRTDSAENAQNKTGGNSPGERT